jgi:hypothetical protein
MSTTFLRNLDECITCHILYTYPSAPIYLSKNQLTFVGFMHELEEFVDDSLEEFPMRLEESGVLADNVHDV